MIPGAGDSAFATTLRARQFVITAEVTPPVSCRRDDLLARALPLRDLADAVNVTDGAGARAHMDAVTAAAILRQNGIEPILQLVCRDRNRLALQGSLLAAATWDVRNLLLLRGDNPAAGDQPDAKGVFDLDARGLIETAATMRDRRQLPNGRALAGTPDFFIGAADTPLDPPPGFAPAGLKAKIAAGAQFAQTQFCMDAGIVRRYRGALAAHNIGDDFYILIGIALLRSAKSAQWISAHLPGAVIPPAIVARMQAADDPVAEGRRICLSLMEELAAIPGVAGVHVMAPGHDAEVGPLLSLARKLDLRRAR